MKTTNVTVKSSLGCKPELMYLSETLCNVVYNPSRFSALRIEHRMCTSKCIVFTSGYICCHGPSYKEARSNLRKYARLIQKKGYDVKLDNIKLMTVSIMHDIGVPIDYNALKETFNALSYEPEIFPSGACLKLGRIHVNIFKSGKITAVGLKSEKIPRCLRRLISTLKYLPATSP